MELQLFRMQRLAVALDVGRAGEHLRAQAAKLARHQVGIGQGTHAQGEIGLAGDQVQLLVAHVHVQADLRVLRMELAQQRRDPGDADRIGHGEAQPAAWARLQLADRAFGFFKLARDALAMLVIDRAGLGEAEAARGPVQ
ncbi:hypothetical protein D3C72_957090 [compost metagenome]